ncbi:MAG: hypothetical protein ACRD0C_24105, partial [Acidimicrobiia bacterium]
MTPPSSRLLRGYGPLLAFAVLFCLMAAFVPTVGTEVRTVPAAGRVDEPGARDAEDALAGEDAASTPTSAAAGTGGATSAGGRPSSAAGGTSRPGACLLNTSPIPRDLV